MNDKNIGQWFIITLQAYIILSVLGHWYTFSASKKVLFLSLSIIVLISMTDLFWDFMDWLEKRKEKRQ